MSKFVQYNTVMTDGDCLKKVLGNRFKEVEQHQTPQPLIDFQGRQTKYIDKDGDKAEIIVRRKYVGGSSNDIGFAKDAKGNYQAIISEYDRHKQNDKWLESLSRDYLIEKAGRIMTEQEGELFGDPETLSDGSIRIQWKMPQYA